MGFFLGAVGAPGWLGSGLGGAEEGGIGGHLVAEYLHGTANGIQKDP